MKDSETRPHAEISSSKIPIQLKCSGSIILGRQLPPKDPTDSMLSGTMTHDLSETALEYFLQSKITGSEPDPQFVELLAKDIEREDRIKGYVQAVYEKALEGSITSKAYAIEDKLTIHEEFQIYGYADFWAVYKDQRAKRAAIVVDLKDGQVSVDAKTDQLKFLACALLEEFRREGIELDYVRAAIYQSRASEDKRYSEVKYTAKQLDTFKAKVLKLAEDVYLKKKVKFKTGSWCRYCKAQELCPEYGKSLQNKTSLKLLEPSAIEFPKPEVIPDETLRNIILNLGALDDFTQACKKYAISRSINGKPIEGLKLVEGSSKRRVDKSRENEIDLFFTNHGINPFDRKLKGIGKLGAELKKKGLSKDLVDSFCVQGVKPLLLVEEADPRQAVTDAMSLLKQQEITEDKEDD